MKYKTLKISEKTHALLSLMREDETYNSLIKRLIENYTFSGLEKQLAEIKTIALIPLLLSSTNHRDQGKELLNDLVSKIVLSQEPRD